MSDMITADNILELILGSVSESEFFQQYWEQNPLHVSRSSAEHFSSLLNVDAIESLLSTQALYFPTVQLTQSAKTIDVSDYTDETRRIVPHRLIERHHAGATLVISQAHELIKSLADFRRNTQRALTLRCQTNVYLSPKGQQGFNAHFDSHDVFILQVAGTKVFNFYEGGVELPYQHDNFQADKHTVGALTVSITLEPGDTLYIPRGVLHDAIATDQTSLHITLGVYPMTHRDVLLEMVQQLTQHNPAYRKSVPRQRLATNNKQRITDTEELTHLLQPELLPENILAAIASIEDTVAVESMPSCAAMLTKPTATSTKSFDSQRITLRLSEVLSVDESPELIRVRTHGQTLEFSAPLRHVVEQLLKGACLQLNKQHDLNNEQKQLLVTTLSTANLLIIEHC